MNASMYSTGTYGFLRELPLFATDVKMSGALQITSADQPLGDTFDGFGVAITASSCYELSTMPADVRREFLEKVYDKNGLALTTGRLSIASSDYSPELYSYDDVAGDISLAHFSVARDEAYVLPMLKEVLRLAPDLKLLASPWSPPGWMKTGGSMCGGCMRNQYVDVYADYFVKFLQAYEAHGIKIAAVTPQNETQASQNGTMPACVWHPDTEATFISVLRKKLTENGFQTEIWMHDHNFADWPKVLWMLQEYPQLLEDCGAVAMHYYNGFPEQMHHIRQEFPQVKLHFTEGGPRLFDNYATDWCKWGTVMTRALNMGMKSFLGWNLLLDETGGPNIGPFFCGGLATLNSQTGELSYSGQYRALDHFSRFVKPGACIYPATADIQGQQLFSYPKLSREVECTVAKNPDGSTVLHIVNGAEGKAQLQYAYGGQLWYIEALPNTLNTVVFA